MEREYWPTEQWRSINEQKNNTQIDKIETMIKEEYSNIKGVAVVKNGYMIYEKYFNGYGENDTPTVASVTKSIISALIGIAIDKGYLKSVDEKVMDFFPEYDFPEDNSIRNEITIKHLLTMTAPYDFPEWQEPLEKMCMSNDWVKFALSMLGKNGYVGKFKYCTGGTHVLSAIITKVTGKSAREFANENLFKAIGMRQIPYHEIEEYDYDNICGKKVRGWVHDPNNISTGGWGITLTPRDMAKFGYLYLNNGLWDGKQVISSKWIKESTEMNSNNYGYLWWLRNDDGIKVNLALGDGGNVICYIPEKDFVVAIASEVIMNAKDRSELIKEIMKI